MNAIISILSIVITAFFAYNFTEIIKKIRAGRSVNKLSLLATSSLIFHFLSISIHFIFDVEWLVLISEIYMLGCLLYLFKKK